MANNNKPANPYANPIHTDTMIGGEGLTLLDHFAVLAMQSYIINDNGTSDEQIAKYSYSIAATMLEERQKHL